MKAEATEPKSSRHPCFKLESPEALLELRQRIWDHHQNGGAAAPKEADKPGEADSGTLQTQKLAAHECAYRDELGSKGVEYPQRFFARDYAGNRLEFSL